MSGLRLAYDKGTLLLEGAAADAVPPAFVQDPRVGLPRAPGLVYRNALTHLHRSGFEYVDEARAYGPLALEFQARQTPFEHQQEALDAWVEGGRRGLVVLPTGSGKTHVAELAMVAVQRSTLIVVPTIDLMTQWYDRLVTVFGIDVGLVGGGHHVIEDVTVTTYDSAYLHLEKLGNRFGLLVFDEVHHLPGPSFAMAAEGSIAPFRLGLTATPEREDGGHQHYERLVGPLAYRREIGELKGDVLSEYRVEKLEVDLTPEERERYEAARITYRDFIEEEGIRLGGPRGWQRFLAATNRSARGRRALRGYQEQKSISLMPESKQPVLEGILRRHAGERALIFTNDNASVYRISRALLIPAITHQTDVKERKEHLDAFRAGRVQALVTSRVLNEGVDVPAASVGVVLSGTGSVREHVQRLGRILRRAEGKQAVLYEVVTAGTSEARTSRKRRDHDAYR